MMRLMLLILITVLFALGSPLPASAQDQITLDEVVTIVREHSPAARALRAQIAVADANIALAGVYPNPELSYVGMGRFDGTNAAINGSQHQVWIDVPLLIAGQHDARRDVAAAEATTARAELIVALLDLEIDARRAFLVLLTMQERVARIEATRADLIRVQGIIDSRTDAGAQSRYDSTRMAVEVARLDANLAVARAETRVASAALAALAGRPGWAPQANGTLQGQDRQYASVDDLPAVRAARAREQSAERDVQRAELERIPEIRLGGGAYFTTDLGSASVYVGLSVPLPIFDTGEAAVRRARAARDATIEARQAVEQRARARLEGALTILLVRRDALVSFDTDAAARLPELMQMAESSYRLGGSGIFELLDAFRARLELELARIELLASAIEAEINVLAVSGH